MLTQRVFVHSVAIHASYYKLFFLVCPVVSTNKCLIRNDCSANITMITTCIHASSVMVFFFRCIYNNLAICTLYMLCYVPSQVVSHMALLWARSATTTLFKYIWCTVRIKVQIKWKSVYLCAMCAMCAMCACIWMDLFESTKWNVKSCIRWAIEFSIADGNAFIGLKTVDTIILLPSIFIQLLHTHTLNTYAHFQLRIWFCIHKHNTTRCKCKQLGHFSFCYVQKFIDKCSVINFHDNIFIFALSFHTFFCTSNSHFIFHHPSEHLPTTMICTVFLCIIICRAFVLYPVSFLFLSVCLAVASSVGFN